MMRLHSWLLLALVANTLGAQPPQLQRPSDPPSIEPRDAADGNSPQLGTPPQLSIPPFTPETSQPPEPPPQIDERTRRQIQQALQGDSGIETGDPILDETLKAIRSRGSLLKDWPADQALYQSEPLAGGAAQPPVLSEDHYLTAESLLRSARLLSQLPNLDAERQQLIHRLRSEARRCLAAGDASSAPHSAH